MKKDNPRLQALYSLKDVLHGGKRPKDCIQRYGSVLDRRDRAMLQEILYGVLRNLYYLDWRLKHYLTKPDRLKKETLNNLRIGLYQALFMRVPDWAVVNETVKIEKSTGRNHRLVNAVLRNIIRDREEPPLPDDPVKRLCILYSHPEWLVRRWITRFGLSETEQLLKANNQIPHLTIRVNRLRRTREDIMKRLRQKGLDVCLTKHSDAGIKIKPPYDFQEIEAMIGDIFIQDEAAQMISILLQPKNGEKILDACAAPGGKSTHIAELTDDSAEIYAVDNSAYRIERMRQNIQKGGYRSIKVVEGDVMALKLRESFDRILLDSPCSSLGVIRRNPDLKYKYTEDDLKGFHQRELNLLLSVSEFLRPGGLLLYSVCSIEPEETEDAVREFLHKRKDFYIIDREVGLEAFIDDRGFFWTLPHRDEMDGFFAVRLSKR